MANERITPRFLLALEAAHALHAAQRRKGTDIPYLTHLMNVASLVLQFGGDEDQAIAGLLHDAAEDQGGRPTLEKVRLAFGDRVAAIVDGCTDAWTEPKPPWRARKEAYVASLAKKPAEVLLVSAADKLDNARAINADLRVHGEALWERFSGGKQSLWYYDALARAYVERGVGPLAIVLDAAVAEMHALAGEALPRPRSPRDLMDGHVHRGA
ncbi:MAG: HD domain-containing protein [Anaeromyxobacteraceae bacterium]